MEIKILKPFNDKTNNDKRMEIGDILEVSDGRGVFLIDMGFAEQITDYRTKEPSTRRRAWNTNETEES